MKDETKALAQHILNDMRDWEPRRWGPFTAQYYSGVSGRQWQLGFAMFGLGISIFYFENNNNDGPRQTERT